LVEMGLKNCFFYTGNEPISPVSISSLISMPTGPPECVGIFTGSCALQSL